MWSSEPFSNVTSAAVVAGDSAAYTNFANRATIAGSILDGTHAPLYKTLLDGLTTDDIIQSDGTSSRLDALYIFATQGVTVAKLNLISGSFNISSVGTNVDVIVPVGSAGFAIDYGYKGDTSTIYLDSNFNPSVGTPKYSLSSASVGAYIYNNRTSLGGQYAFGAQENGNVFLVGYNYGAGSACIHGATITISQPVLGTNGLWILSRTTSTQADIYNWSDTNGTSGNCGSDTSTAGAFLPTQDICFLASNQGGTVGVFDSAQISAGFIGAGLDVTYAGKLKSRLNHYMASLPTSINMFPDT